MLAFKDGKVDDEEENEDNEQNTEEDKWKDLLIKAKKARDQSTSHMADCQAALELADKAKRLTKNAKAESEDLLKGMSKKTNALKDLLAKKNKWGSLAKAKSLLVDAAKEMKKVKDEAKELNQLANKTNSKASKKYPQGHRPWFAATTLSKGYWSCGAKAGSVPAAAEIAHSACLEGANSQETMRIAKCGNFSQCPGNSHRDMMQLFLKDLQLCDPWPVKVEVKDPKTQKLAKTEAPVMLPHLLFSSLYEHYRDQFEELFAVKQCASFWQNLEKKEDPRLVPPITLDKKEDPRLVPPITLDKRVVPPSTTIPIFVHGDGVEFVRDSSLMTFSWGSMLSQQSSLATHLLLAAWPKSCQTPETWKPLDKVISWSLSALAKGFHPTEDWDGKALAKGLLFEKAGLPLTKGKFRAVIYSIQGDQEFYSNILKLGRWQSKFPCHECDSEQFQAQEKAMPSR
eukprot:s1572_g21.t1